MRSRGQGPDLLLLHGSGAPAASLEPLAARLSQTHRVWLPDMPGYEGRMGEAYAPSAELVASLRDELVAQGVQELVIIGHSFGAFRMFHMGLIAAPLKLRALIGLSPLASLPEEVRAGMAGFGDALRAGVDLSGAMVPRWYAPDYAAQHPELAAQIAGWIKRIDVEVLTHELVEPIDGGALSARLGELECPVYLRVGELDQATSPMLVGDVYARLKNASYTQVKGLGHMQAEEDCDRLVAWIHGVLSAL
jgi:pimeloyl-ACP methyl ester carboxylesterase